MLLYFRKIILLSFCILLSGICLAQSGESKLPPWIQSKIDSKEPLQFIEKYKLKEATVYVVQTVCCDQGARELYDETGKLICKMPESFAGLDYSKCPEFGRYGEWIASIYKMPLTSSEAKFKLENENRGKAARKTILTDASYGAIKFGSKLSDIEKSIGQKAWRHPYEGYNDTCRFVSFGKYEAVDVKVEKGIVTGVRSSRFDWTTTSLGITSETRLPEIEAKFPDMKTVKDKFDEGTQYAIFESKDHKRAMVFRVTRKRFAAVSAGLRPSVDAPSGCP
jgi:hypothetical protein